MSENKRTAKISNTQLQTMLEFINGHPELTLGKFTPSFTYKDSQRLWQELAVILNAIPGSQKTWVQWRKAWQDKRTKTRKKKADINSHCLGTGGGKPSTVVLTPVEEGVLGLIAPTHIEGHANISESKTEFDHDFNSILELGNDAELVFENSFSSLPSCNNSSEHPIIKADICDPVESIEMPSSSCMHQSRPLNEPVSFVQTGKQTPATKPAAESTPVKPKGKKKHVGVQRLHHSVEATSALAEAVKMKNAIKQDYYAKKIELLTQQTCAFERMATALEKFVENK